MEDRFLKYIESRPKSAKSGPNYVSGLKSISERFLHKDLFSILSSSEVDKIIIDLKNNNEFIVANEKGHHMYLRAIKHYRDFLSNEQDCNNTDNTLSEIQQYLAIEMLIAVEQGQLRIEYNELSDILNKKYNININPHTQMPHLIGDISKICYTKLNLPMLSCIVVNKETQLPGIGFYKLYDELYSTNYAGNKYFEKKCREEVKKEIQNCNEWYKLTDYLNIQIDEITAPFSNNYVSDVKAKPALKDNNVIQKKKLAPVFDENLINEIEHEIKTETEKEILVKARIGHSQLKEKILSIKDKCEICGLSHPKLLIASHIKPWSKSDNYEKLDPNNILLLCSIHDALFDKGLISFDENGNVLISKEFDENTQTLTNINKNGCINVISEKQKEYLKYHRENIFIE